MVGVPESERQPFVDASNAVVGRSDPKMFDPSNPMGRIIDSARYLNQLGQDLAAHRRKHPADDIMTSLVQAEVDGHKLTDEDIGGFTFLMSVASNDTTKQTTSHPMLALSRNPDQLAWLKRTSTRECRWRSTNSCAGPPLWARIHAQSRETLNSGVQR